MLRLLDVYTVAEGFTDHPLYDGERYRQGPQIRVDAGTKVRPLHLLKASDHPGDSLYMGQLINEDGSSGGKVRIYDGDLVEARAEESTVRVTSTGAGTSDTVIRAEVWDVNPFYEEVFTSIPTSGTAVGNYLQAYGGELPSYVNTADSILRGTYDDIPTETGRG